MFKKFLLIPILFTIFACGDSGPTISPNGEACDVGEDCLSGECWEELVSFDFFSGEKYVFTLDDGMCSTECTWSSEGTFEEQAQGTCSENEFCLVYGFSESICFQACSVDLPCREDYVCTAIDHIISSCLPPDDSARVLSGDLIITAYPEVAK